MLTGLGTERTVIGKMPGNQVFEFAWLPAISGNGSYSEPANCYNSAKYSHLNFLRDELCTKRQNYPIS